MAPDGLSDIDNAPAAAVAGPLVGIPRTAGPYRMVRPGNAQAALARAVELCARHEAFAARPFGHWARVLIGQVNRGQYRFVMREGGGIVGFAGWFRTDAASAERWLVGATGVGSDPSGSCVVLNALVADEPGAIAALLAGARELEAAPYTLYAKRLYAGGRMRPVRLPVRARRGGPVATSIPGGP